MKYLTIKLVAIAALIASQHSASALQRNDLLPADTTVRIHIPNMSSLVTAITNAPVALMWKDKAFQAFMGDIDLREAFLEQETRDLGNREAAELQLRELQMLQGEIVLGVTMRGEDEFSFSAVGHLTRDDYLDSLDMDRRISELSKDDATIVNHDFQGEQIVEMRHVAEGDAPEEISFQSHVGETLLLSDNRGWVESTLIKLRAGAIEEPAEPTPGLYARIDGKQLMTFVQTMIDESIPENTAGPNGAPQGPQPAKGAFVAGMGLDQIEDINLSIDFFDDKLEMATDMHLGEALTGVLSILDTRPVDAITPVPYPQDDLFMAEHSRLDMADLWQEVPRMMAAIAPGSEMMLGMVMMSFGGIDPGRDIFAHMDTTISRVSRLRDGVPEELMFWRLNNPDALRQTLDGAMAEGKPLRTQLGATMKVDSFRDHTIYTFPDASTGQRAGVAVAGEHLVMGSADMIRASIRTLDAPQARNPFMSSPVYNRLFRIAPRNAFSVGIIDWQRLVQTALKQDATVDNPFTEMMKAQQKSTASQEGAPDAWANINWDKFPPAQFFARFLGPSLTYSEAAGGKILSRVITFYPETP